MNQKPLLTAEQVGELLNVAVAEVWRMARSGALPCIRLGHRTMRFDPDDVQKYIDNKREQAIDWSIAREIPF